MICCIGGCVRFFFVSVIFGFLLLILLWYLVKWSLSFGCFNLDEFLYLFLVFFEEFLLILGIIWVGLFIVFDKYLLISKNKIVNDDIF